MPGRPLTVEDLWAMPRVGSPEPAPDGSRVIVPVTTYNMETNEATTRLWLVPATGGAGAAAGGGGGGAYSCGGGAYCCCCSAYCCWSCAAYF